MNSSKDDIEVHSREWTGSRGSAKKTEDLERSDERYLARTGKKQVLKRRFGFVSMLGMSTTLMLTWEGVLIYLGQGLLNGGSAGLIYSFILSWFGTISVMACLAELASMVPTAAGQYHWVAIMAPKPLKNVLSYVVGWMSVAVWQAIVTMTAYVCGTLIQGLVVLNFPNAYTPAGWHGTLMLWAAVLVAFFINTGLARWLPKIEGFILYLHLLGFFAIMVPMLYLSDRVPAKEVFTTFQNGGEFPTMGVSFLVGMITNVGSLLGSDGAVHMSEEIHNAAVIVPWNIIITLCVNGILGFGMLLATLFSLSDPDSALSTLTGYPFIQIFFDTTHSHVGTSLMVVLPLLLCFAALFGQFASASRQMWSFARDQGLPFSNRLMLVNPKSLLPMNSILMTCGISIILALITIGSAVALLNILSFIVSCWLTAATVPLTLLLWRRTTGGIRTSAPRQNTFASTSSDSDIIEQDALVWGPWRLPEPFGTVVNVFGLGWIFVALFFSFWPNYMTVTPATMNFSCLMTGFWFIFGVLYYAIWGKKHYKGPIVETK